MVGWAGGGGGRGEGGGGCGRELGEDTYMVASGEGID
jgi:hypothetical protein